MVSTNPTPLPEKVDPRLSTQLDPNIALYQTIKADWGARNDQDNSTEAQIPVKYRTLTIGGADDWYEGGPTPHISVWPSPDTIGRMGVGSSKRYHHSKHTIWLWCRTPDERWLCYVEIMRILQKYAIKPRAGIERFDYYNAIPFQQPAGPKMGLMYRMQIDVTAIWVR